MRLPRSSGMTGKRVMINDKGIRKRIEALQKKLELPLFCAPSVHLPSQLIESIGAICDHWFGKPMVRAGILHFQCKTLCSFFLEYPQLRR